MARFHDAATPRLDGKRTTDTHGARSTPAPLSITELIDRDINGVEHPSDEIGPQNWDGEDRIMGRRAA